MWIWSVTLVNSIFKSFICGLSYNVYIMSKLSIKNILSGGVLIFVMDLVVGYLVKGLPSNLITLSSSMLVLFLIPFFVSRVTLGGMEKLAILNGFVQGIVASFLLVVFMSGFYKLTLVVNIVGALIGGYSISKKR